jgi:hypothetical protein
LFEDVMEIMIKVQKEVRKEDEEIERKKLVDNGALLYIMDIKNSMAIFFSIRSNGLN